MHPTSLDIIHPQALLSHMQLFALVQINFFLNYSVNMYEIDSTFRYGGQLRTKRTLVV